MGQGEFFYSNPNENKCSSHLPGPHYARPTSALLACAYPRLLLLVHGVPDYSWYARISSSAMVTIQFGTKQGEGVQSKRSGYDGCVCRDAR